MARPWREIKRKENKKAQHTKTQKAKRGRVEECALFWQIKNPPNTYRNPLVAKSSWPLMCQNGVFPLKIQSCKDIFNKALYKLWRVYIMPMTVGFCLETWFHRNTAVSSQVCSVLAARALLTLRSVAASSGCSPIYSSALCPVTVRLGLPALCASPAFRNCKFPVTNQWQRKLKIQIMYICFKIVSVLLFYKPYFNVILMYFRMRWGQPWSTMPTKVSIPRFKFTSHWARRTWPWR